MKRLSTVVLVLGSVLSFVACGSESTITISGSVLILQEQNFSQTGSSCTGVGALSRLREDATVTIDDRTATLSRGTITGEGNCRFLFLADVPAKDDPKRYSFKVDGLPPTVGIVNTRVPIDWQAADADGWVTIGWD